MSSDDALKNSTPEEIVRENVVEDDGEDPFDGVLSDSTRGAVVEHGLPLDLASFTTRDSDQELEAGTEVTRALTALDLSGPTPHALEPDSLAEFDAASATRGGFVAGAGLFGSAELTAPAVHFAARLAHTTFKSPKPLTTLMKDLGAAFAALSVSASREGPEEGCCWRGSATATRALVEIEVCLYTPTEGVGHLVEVRRLSGCRYAFSEVAAGLAGRLGAAQYLDGPALAMPSAPPALSKDALLGMPTLRRAVSGEAGAGAPVGAAPPPPAAEAPDVPEALSASADEVCTAQHVTALLAPAAGLQSQIQGCRAAGALAAGIESCMGSCALRGCCGADHRGHAKLFAAGGAWLGVASRVAELAAEPATGASPVHEPLLAELRFAAMGAVATVSALQHVCADWLANEAVAAAAGGVAGGEADPHTRREALRATEALATRDTALAQQLAAVEGLTEALESEASGRADDAAQKYAQGALAACRT